MAQFKHKNNILIGGVGGDREVCDLLVGEVASYGQLVGKVVGWGLTVADVTGLAAAVVVVHAVGILGAGVVLVGGGIAGESD